MEDGPLPCWRDVHFVEAVDTFMEAVDTITATPMTVLKVRVVIEGVLAFLPLQC